MDLNKSKKDILYDFIFDYQNLVKYYINFIWNNRINYSMKIREKYIENGEEKNNLVLKDFSIDIKNNIFDIPKFLSNSLFPEINTKLSGRAQKCALNQSLSIIKGHLSKHKKYQFVLHKLKYENKRTRSITNKINKLELSYPDISNINPELNSICIKYIDNPDNISHFDGLIILSSIGKEYGKIIIPIKNTKHSKKLKDSSVRMLNSFSINNNYIGFRYEMKKEDKKKVGNTVGIDTGINSCYTISDKQESIKDIHGHDLKSITEKLARKKNGSKAFKRAKEHQKNYIHWTINKINFSDIKEVRLEKISNYRNGKRTNRLFNFFPNRLVQDLISEKCKLNGVHFTLQNSSFRSQRCSCCGYVDSNNRKGKSFSCKHCGFQADADYNASCNHEIDLPSANSLRLFKDRPKKFFWKINGFFSLEDQEITVPDTKKYKK